MDRIRQYLLPVLVLMLLVSLGVSLRSYFMAYIIQPVALLFWAAWRAISSVNQSVYWILLICLCFLLSMRLVLSGNISSPPSAYYENDRHLNPVEAWCSILYGATLGMKARADLRERLVKLLLAALADDERSGSTDLMEVIANRQLPLSQKARQLLWPPDEKSARFFWLQPRRLMAFAPGWLRGWLSGFVHQDNIVVDEILTYIETELEIRHAK